MAAARDGYVPAVATAALHDHWTGSELRWVGGGHASLLITGLGALAGAIEDSFDRTFGSRGIV